MEISMQKIKYNSLLARNIKRLRNNAGLTQEQITIQLQLLDCDPSRGTYAKIEAGIQNISLKELTALKDIFQADWSDLLE